MSSILCQDKEHLQAVTEYDKYTLSIHHDHDKHLLRCENVIVSFRFQTWTFYTLTLFRSFSKAKSTKAMSFHNKTHSSSQFCKMLQRCCPRVTKNQLFSHFFQVSMTLCTHQEIHQSRVTRWQLHIRHRFHLPRYR